MPRDSDELPSNRSTSVALEQKPRPPTLSHGRAELVEALCAANAKVDQPSDHGRTPLLLAVVHGQGATVRALVMRRAEPNHAAEHGYTPLHVAVLGGLIASRTRALFCVGGSVYFMPVVSECSNALHPGVRY